MFDFLDWVFDTVADVVDIGSEALSRAATTFQEGVSSLLDTSAPPPIEPPAPPPVAEAPAPVVPEPQPAPVAPQAPVAPPPQVAAVPEPASDMAPRMGSGSLELGGNGIVGSAAKWFRELSPGAQAVIAQGIAGGAGALMQGLAQRNAQEAQEEREERAREDRARRGAIPAFGSAFRPKGIINGARG